MLARALTRAIGCSGSSRCTTCRIAGVSDNGSPAVFTTSVMLPDGRCGCGKYVSARASSSGPDLRALLTTPTIVSHCVFAPSDPNEIRLPTASSVSKYVKASASFTTTTRWTVARSALGDVATAHNAHADGVEVARRHRVDRDRQTPQSFGEIRSTLDDDRR